MDIHQYRVNAGAPSLADDATVRRQPAAVVLRPPLSISTPVSTRWWDGGASCRVFIVTSSSALIGWIAMVLSKSALVCPHLHRNGEALHHLLDVVADQVNTDDTFVVAAADQFHRGGDAVTTAHGASA